MDHAPVENTSPNYIASALSQLNFIQLLVQVTILATHWESKDHTLLGSNKKEVWSCVSFVDKWLCTQNLLTVFPAYPFQGTCDRIDPYGTPLPRAAGCPTFLSGLSRGEQVRRSHDQWCKRLLTVLKNSTWTRSSPEGDHQLMRLMQSLCHTQARNWIERDQETGKTTLTHSHTQTAEIHFHHSLWVKS